MSHARPHGLRRRIGALLALALWGLMLLPVSTHAATYWVDLSVDRGEIGAGVNGFSFVTNGGPWTTNASRCQAAPGAYVAGASCKLRFTVPPGLTAGAATNSGLATLSFGRTNSYAMLRVERPGGTPSNVTDSTDTGTITRSWGIVGQRLDFGIRFSAAATVSNTTNWMRMTRFQIPLHDDSAPVLSQLTAGNSGWNGPGCAAHAHTWTDAGSQLAAVTITQAWNGLLVDGWGTDEQGVTTGHGTVTDTGCIPVPGSGAYTYRARAVDRAGNARTRDFTLQFDATAPVIDAVTLDGAPLTDDAEVGAAHGYRPAVTWSGLSDAHSGISSVTTTVDGVTVPHERDGARVTLALTKPLQEGRRVIALTVTDAVGNAATSTRSVRVVDTVAPELIVHSPDPSGGSEPVLDVTAQDDFSGIDPASWTVRVNGATLVASSPHHRLQAAIGYLIDGTHAIEVEVADHAGNVGRIELEYVADSGDDLPDAPGLTGLYVLSAPSSVRSGATHHVRAIAVQAGRPVQGRVELRAGPLVLGAAEVAPSGAVTVDARIAVPGPLMLHPPAGTGLEPVPITYDFEEPAPEPEAEVDAADEPDPALAPADAPAPVVHHVTTTNNVTHAAPAQPGSAAAPTVGADGSYPRNVVYYVGTVPFWNGVPLAESGAPLDTVAPRWRLTLRQQRAGHVRRTRRITMRLWTNEMAVLQLTPQGSVRRITMSPRRRMRTIQIAIKPRTRLARRLAAARPGRLVTVRLRVIATDKNENRSHPRTITLRVRA